MSSLALSIPSRFRGPPDSGNGGYSAGLLARHLAGVSEVTLRKPPPLEAELSLHVGAELTTLAHGDTLIAEARPASLELDVPSAPSYERAASASANYVGHQRHHFPSCFVCGPGRAPGDGLRIFPGAEPGERAVVAPWTPDVSLGSEADGVPFEVVWAALDCAGYFASAAPEYPIALLGRMTAEIVRRPRHGERCVVTGWSLGREGRKLYAATAVFGHDGLLCGRARQTWIALEERK